MSASATLNWTPAGGTNSLGQDVQYKVRTSSTWITFSSVGPYISSAVITGLVDNTLYDFRIVNDCAFGGPAPTNLTSNIKFVCPVVTITPTYNQISVSFTAQGASIDRYVIELLNGAGTAVLSTIDKPSPSGTVSGTFTSLPAATAYKVRVTMYATADFSNQCLATAVSTTAAPTCGIPTGVTATMS